MARDGKSRHFHGSLCGRPPRDASTEAWHAAGVSPVIAYALLLGYGILTLWVTDRWAWSFFQTGMFALAIWRGIRPAPILIPLVAAASWPLLQLAAGTTASRGATI